MTTVLSPLRASRITGSRVGAVLGLNKHQTADDVLREMVRQFADAEPEFEGNDATEWGNDHEADALAAYTRITGNYVHSAQDFVMHPDHPFLGVSPDGLVGDAGMVETKCPWRATYTTVAERPHYEAQVQLQLACTGRSWCDFVIWRGDDDVIVETVTADPSWLPSVLPTLETFMRLYTETIADPALTQIHLEPLVADRGDVAWQVAADEYLTAQAAQADAEARTKDARARLLELADDKPTKGCGVSVLRSERKGALDTKAAEKSGLDLEVYRKPATVVWTVRAAS